MTSAPQNAKDGDLYRERVLTVRKLFRLAITAPQEVERLLEICLLAAIDDGAIAEEGSVFIRTFGSDDKLTLLKKAGENKEIREFGEFHIGEGLAGLVASTGEPITSQDCSQDSRYKHYKDEPQLRSFIGVPVICRETVMGVICAHNITSKTSFSEEHKEFLMDLANVAAVSILANCNDLTLLPNRGLMNTLLDMEIEFAISRGHPLCLAYIDIDRFGKYNDEYGHDKADQLIQQLGDIMKRSIPGNATLCHRHGDEFAIIFKEQELGKAEEASNQLLEKIRAFNFSVDGTSVNSFRPLTISIGLAARRSLDDRESLLRRADLLNQAAKTAGRNQVVVEL